MEEVGVGSNAVGSDGKREQNDGRICRVAMLLRYNRSKVNAESKIECLARRLVLWCRKQMRCRLFRRCEGEDVAEVVNAM